MAERVENDGIWRMDVTDQLQAIDPWLPLTACSIYRRIKFADGPVKTSIEPGAARWIDIDSLLNDMRFALPDRDLDAHRPWVRSLIEKLAASTVTIAEPFGAGDDNEARLVTKEISLFSIGRRVRGNEPEPHCYEMIVGNRDAIACYPPVWDVGPIPEPDRIRVRQVVNLCGLADSPLAPFERN